MGAVIRIEPDKLPSALELGEQNIRRAVAQGALAGAHRGRALMVQNTPSDQGQLRASWKVTPGAREFTGFSDTLATLINDAPHISIVELGARPHAVNPEGWQSIYEWVRRHYRGGASGAGVGQYSLGGSGRMRPRGRGVTGPFKGDDPVIEAITNAIVWRIRKFGQKATLFVRNSVDDLRRILGYEMERAIKIAHQQNSAAKGGKP